MLRDAHCFDRGLFEGGRRALRVVRRKRGSAEGACATSGRFETAKDRARPKGLSAAYRTSRAHSACDVTLFAPAEADDGESQFCGCRDAAIQRHDGRRAWRTRGLPAAACACTSRASEGTETRKRLRENRSATGGGGGGHRARRDPRQSQRTRQDVAVDGEGSPAA